MKNIDTQFIAWKKLKDLIDDAQAGVGNTDSIARGFFFGSRKYEKDYGVPFKYTENPKEQKK